MEKTDLLCFVQFESGSYLEAPPQEEEDDPGGPVGYTDRGRAAKEAYKRGGFAVIKPLGEMMDACDVVGRLVHVDDSNITGKWVILPEKGTK